MRRVFCVSLLLGFLAPAPSLAVTTGRPEIPHPLSMTPAEPETPPDVPVEGAPPVLDLTLPEPQSRLADLPDAASGIGEPPDLTGQVILPDAALPFRGKGARPFGGAPSGKPAGDATVVPEPGTGLLMMLGLGGLAVVGRARR
jgi:hypothetical protein